MKKNVLKTSSEYKFDGESHFVYLVEKGKFREVKKGVSMNFYTSDEAEYERKCAEFAKKEEKERKIFAREEEARELEQKRIDEDPDTIMNIVFGYGTGNIGRTQSSTNGEKQSTTHTSEEDAGKLEEIEDPDALMNAVFGYNKGRIQSSANAANRSATYRQDVQKRAKATKKRNIRNHPKILKWKSRMKSKIKSAVTKMIDTLRADYLPNPNEPKGPNTPGRDER